MKTIIKAVLSILFVIFFQMNIDMYVLPFDSFYTKDRVLDVFLFVIIYVSFRVWQDGKNEYKRWSLIIASLLAGFYVLGYNIERYLDIFTEFNRNWIIGKLFLKWLSCWYVFSMLLLYFFKRLDDLKQMDVCRRIKNVSKSIRYLIFILIFAIVWLPFYIDNYPGVIYGDSWNQIYQALGIENFTTHHPVMHTLLLKICLVVCHEPESGIVLYSIVSFLGIIAILAGIINLMIEEDFDFRVIIISGLIYVFFPSIPMFAVTVTKDSWFAAFVGLFLVELYIVLMNKKWGGHFVGLTGSAIGMGIFRKNGIYLLIFTVLYMLIYICLKKAKMGKVMFICTLAIFVSIGIEKGAVYFLSIDQGSPREMLSLPIQQMARIEKNVKELDDEMRKEIDSYFKEGSSLGEAYYPLISDNAKDRFSEKKYDKREKEFLILSAKLFLAYPEESLEAFMCNSFGYWYPITINWFYVKNNDKQLNIEETVLKHEYPLNVEYIYFDEFKNITGAASLFSIGIVFWFFMIIGGYLAANKDYEKLTILVPLGALWLTSAASPVYNELRYVLSIYTAFPVICQLMFGKTTGNFLNEKGVL